MRVIGITGPTGAGKTTALRAVEALGGVVLDCDAIYKELLQTDPALLSAIERRFPGAVKDGALDRAALAEAVFHDPKALGDLSAITHPVVLREVKRRLSQAERDGCPLAAVDAIALFESGLSELCGETVFVSAPVETRLARIMARDGIDRRAAAARIAAQNGDEYFRAQCDGELRNTYSDSGDFTRCCVEYFRRFIHE